MSTSNLFRDKEYEQLDWLNKAVEPFLFPANELMVQLPDRIDFGIEAIMDVVLQNNSITIQRRQLIEYVLNTKNIKFTFNDMHHIQRHFNLEIADNIVVDFEERKMNGVITLVKDKPQLTDEDIKNCLCNDVSHILTRDLQAGFGSISRINEIMDIINCQENRKSRSFNNKIVSINNTLETIIEKDVWRVRNYTLMLQAINWIHQYINTGNLAALSNLTRLKCMTHNGLAIYSMEETI